MSYICRTFAGCFGKSYFVQVDRFKEAKEEFEQRLQDLEERFHFATQAQALREVGEQVEVRGNCGATHVLAVCV